ncbi:hypothetical protein L208DRAFT_1261819 [Tricholoma matsutake]|nr:hypothetical protein L208DRAFT_1261819 [Tricholoma matsutake 945]
MTIPIHSRLPATFTSLYRLFLRTCSATVLHHTLATRNLRQLWRPTFYAAAKVIQELQTGSQDANTRKLKEDWLGVWEKRMDNTLALLYNSCKSRGLSHRLTRNISLLVLSEHQRLRSHRFQTWSPQLPPTSPLYKPAAAPAGKRLKEEKFERWADFDGNAWAALSQVVRMAEGSQGISLGQIAMKRKVWRTKKGN